MKLIGDCHLGKEFKTGVPLHRRGEREEMVWAEFDDALCPGEHKVVIQVGDIFDKHRVDLNVVLDAEAMIRSWACGNPQATWAFLRGNHDASRDSDKVSSFDLLARLLRDLPNVIFAIDGPRYVGDIVLLPWHPFVNATEMAEMIDRPVRVAVGHWDRVAFGDHADNLIPLEILKAKGVGHAISGHDHVPDEWVHDDTLKVTFTGSLQPFSHGEDPKGEIYVTIPLAEALTRDDLVNKCVRVLLEPGESLPLELDCLQLTGKRVGEEDNDITVDFESGLNVMSLFDECLAGIDQKVVAAIRSRFEEIRSA